LKFAIKVFLLWEKLNLLAFKVVTPKTIIQKYKE